MVYTVNTSHMGIIFLHSERFVNVIPISIFFVVFTSAGWCLLVNISTVFCFFKALSLCGKNLHIITICLLPYKMLIYPFPMQHRKYFLKNVSDRFLQFHISGFYDQVNVKLDWGTCKKCLYIKHAFFQGIVV